MKRSKKSTPKKHAGIEKFSVSINGKLVAVSMYPPNPPQRSWYAYWAGLKTRKSTGEKDYGAACAAVEDMLRNGGRKQNIADAVMSDEDFAEIQRIHYRKKQDPAKRARAEKSLIVCLDAIEAFREITGLKPITLATPDDCAAFQRKALQLPKSWRLVYPKANKQDAPHLSPNTVLKWSRALQAAWDRANINSGKKCVRGAVNTSRLLTSNPWHQFLWIEGVDRPIRQFSSDELLSILDYFEQKWEGITVALAATKVCFWSWFRLSEMAGLRWDNVRPVGEEFHLEVVGKAGVEKWCRIPNDLYAELCRLKMDSPYVFAIYNNQLRDHYEKHGPQLAVRNVGGEFSPEAFGNWFQERIPDWATWSGNEHATPHAFRKTALQHARRGEDDLNDRVARDARLTTAVMMKHYVTERDEEFRQASNRMFYRLVESLPPKVAARFGHTSETEEVRLQNQLRDAQQAQDWERVAELAKMLAESRISK
jgi:integrase